MLEDDPLEGLRLMSTQMVAAADAGLHFPALMTALALPDICGALGSSNGRATGAKTRAWIQKWMPIAAPNAAAIYALRCSLLHEGSAHPHGGAPRVLFGVAGPEGANLHGPSLTLPVGPDGEEMTPIGVRPFASDVSQGVRDWLEIHGSSELVLRNADRFARLRLNITIPWLPGGSFIA